MRDILKLINPTLMEHGSRVAYIVYKMLQEENRYEEFELAEKLGAIINLDDITHVDFLKDTLGYIPQKSPAGTTPAACSPWGPARTAIRSWTPPATPSTA